eukprot:CAMPEP_0181335410 /NCGR_PEP_ID=MMETSP1101-20121128/26817_1 /TAXON_ID=46948 /ORGANISM="Rhodomonas abbreviata, Strain Caron Lab Isolate" /LENGTH=338 /DNA_ID=CAMNT_0023445529 /DNA_START=210 /DNA_END=1227 /DNA_ORIENTATION=+
MTVTSDAEATSKEGMLEAERFIIFNRFQTRDDAGPRFEKRWASRKSSLQQLEGFKLFCLLRRCDSIAKDDGSEYRCPEGTPDYMSMTWWQNRKNFNTWRTGHAFKEAHGGGSIAGFLKAMVGSMMVLKGTPKPWAWEGLVVEAKETKDSPLVLQPRNEEGMVESDGSTPLTPECFVAMNRFKVKEGKERAFEAVWEGRESTLSTAAGFAAFTLLRSPSASSSPHKEGGEGAFGGEDKYNYSTCSVWDSKESWQAWMRTSHTPKTEKQSKEGRPGMGELVDGPPSPVFGTASSSFSPPSPPDPFPFSAQKGERGQVPSLNAGPDASLPLLPSVVETVAT